MPDDELDAIRRRRMQEIQAQRDYQAQASSQQQAAAAEQQDRADAMREAALRKVLTMEARERLTRLKMVRPEQADALENQIISLAQSGRLQGPLDDEGLKAILARLSASGRQTTIRRR